MMRHEFFIEEGGDADVRLENCRTEREAEAVSQ